MTGKFVKPKIMKATPQVKAAVLFSGGLDSLVSLIWAKKQYKNRVMAISFNYGQAHKVELNAASELTRQLGVFHRTIYIEYLGSLSKGALIEGNKRAKMFDGNDMHGTLFVPGRNSVMLSIAAATAVTHGANTLVVGEGQSDGTPFPDARKEFFQATAKALSAGLGSAMAIQTPLMGKTKGAGLKLGMKLEPRFLEYAEVSVSCYRGGACGKCPACLLRAQGFEEIGVEDPRKR